MNLESRIELMTGDLHHGTSERFEVVNQCLVDENVSICKKECSFNPPRFPEPPDYLEGRVGLTGSGSHNQQHALLAARNGLDGMINCIRLVIARLLT
jgi:hypothetical protein